MPPWYLTLRAARFMRVPVTTVERMGIEWRGRALAAEEIEADEAERARKRAEKKARRNRMH